jgi:cation:H+ antiporter
MVWAAIRMTFGLVGLVVGAEMLVRGSSSLAIAIRISPLVVGLTVVAFGTSAPELAVSIQSAMQGNADIALGNVIGSNIFNVLLILGSSALIVPLVVASQLIRWDVPLMIAISFILLLLGLDGKIHRADGALLVVGIVAYTYWCIRQSRAESREVQSEFATESPPAPHTPGQVLVQVGLIVGGLILLALGARWLVDGSVTIARTLGVSQLIIGLTIVAVGTSLPELVTSIVAAFRGERDIAVGNVVGSNIFNILSVLGFSSLISLNGVAVSPVALRFDIPVMIAVALSCLPIFFTGHRIARWEGGLFVAYYFAYTAYLILDAVANPLSRTLGNVMLLFVVPLTVIALTVSAMREWRENANPSEPRP